MTSENKPRIEDIEAAIDGTTDYRVDMGDPYTRGYEAGWKNAMHSKYDEQKHMLRARVAALESALAAVEESRDRMAVELAENRSGLAMERAGREKYKADRDRLKATVERVLGALVDYDIKARSILRAAIADEPKGDPDDE